MYEVSNNPVKLTLQDKIPLEGFLVFDTTGVYAIWKTREMAESIATFLNLANHVTHCLSIKSAASQTPAVKEEQRAAS